MIEVANKPYKLAGLQPHTIMSSYHDLHVKSTFVCVVASVFEATTANIMFDYTKNTV